MKTSVGLTEEQLAMRRTGISASEVPAILGLSPWQSPLDVYLNKLGLAETQETDAMRAGNYLEDGICQWYADRTGASLERRGTVRHPSDPWRLATVDRVYSDESRIVECKLVMGSASSWGDEEDGPEGVPEYVRMQVLTQMDVTGIHSADVVAFIPSAKGQKHRIFPVAWDAELAEYAATIVTDFWQSHVQAQEQPPIDGSPAFRDYLARRYPRNNGGMVPASAELRAIAERRANLAAQLDRIEYAIQECDNRIKAAIGDADGLDGIATWKAPSQGAVSWKAVAEALGATKELIERHRGQPSRRFLFKMKEVA